MKRIGLLSNRKQPNNDYELILGDNYSALVASNNITIENPIFLSRYSKAELSE